MEKKLASIVLIAGLAVAACGTAASRPALAGQTRQTCPGSVPRGPAHGPAQRPGLKPRVGAAAFAGHGTLAFVSSRRLYVLNGSAAGRPATVRAVAAPAGATAPAWSRDGRWLAFLVTPPSHHHADATAAGTLWLAHGDGSGARPVLANAGPFSWSPTADVIAAATTDPATGRTGECDVQPGATPALLPGVTGPAIWSPDGRELAFTSIASSPRGGFAGSSLETVPAAGGTPVVRARSTQDAFIAADWWSDGRGLLAWTDPHGSASLAARGLPLVSYPLSGGRPVALATSLAHPSFVATTRSLSVVAIAAGGGPDRWDHATVDVCGQAGGCTGFPGGTPGAANVDPAWSPVAESTLAFVHGSASAPPPPGSGQAALAAWYKTRTLWVFPLAGNPHPMPGAGTSTAAPTWSAGGRFILYVRDNGLWLINASGGPAHRIVGRLFSGAWPSQDGYIAWHEEFAWHN